MREEEHGSENKCEHHSPRWLATEGFTTLAAVGVSDDARGVALDTDFDRGAASSANDRRPLVSSATTMRFMCLPVVSILMYASMMPSTMRTVASVCLRDDRSATDRRSDSGCRSSSAGCCSTRITTIVHTIP